MQMTKLENDSNYAKYNESMGEVLDYANNLGQSLVNTAYHDWRHKLGDDEDLAAIMMLECVSQVYRGIITGMTSAYPDKEDRLEFIRQQLGDLEKGIVKMLDSDPSKIASIRPAASAA